MIDKLYDPRNLDKEEIEYRQDFEKLASEFGAGYEIWIRKEDFNRMLSAAIVNRDSLGDSPVAVKIYLKYSSVPISNPVNPRVIEIAKNHFRSSNSEDLVLNCPR